MATLKNSVIGSQRQKNNIVEHGVIARLIHLLVDPDMNSKVKTDVVYILGSIINGSESNLKSLNEADLANILLQVGTSQYTYKQTRVTFLSQGLTSRDGKLMSACLWCLQSLFRSKTPLFSDLENDSVPSQCQVIYADPATVPLLIGLLEADDTSATHQIAACDVLTSCCRSTEHQNSLVSSGLLTSLTSVLASHVTSVQLAGLHCLASLIYNNTPAGTALTTTSCRGKSLLSLAVYFTGREHGVDIQLAAGRVLTYLYRAEVNIRVILLTSIYELYARCCQRLRLRPWSRTGCCPAWSGCARRRRRPTTGSSRQRHSPISSR